MPREWADAFAEAAGYPTQSGDKTSEVRKLCDGVSRSADPNPFCMTPGLMLAEADAGLPSCTRKGKAGHGNARWAGFFVAYVRVRAPRAQHVARVGSFRVLDRKQRSSVRTDVRINRLVCAR